ncbi:uncharacterized protein LOC119668221 [Teleopsis dalmanni]|uniref:uncharacterized protein LOC119668221 n=1 Tax=Teleopsis dalmanni TaxID=139649 RepID=UPI0018CFD12F|nr:uncharacterized protein LOC119668221 [Teleopsis dalmanni]
MSSNYYRQHHRHRHRHRHRQTQFYQKHPTNLKMPIYLILLLATTTMAYTTNSVSVAPQLQYQLQKQPQLQQQLRISTITQQQQQQQQQQIGSSTAASATFIDDSNISSNSISSTNTGPHTTRNGFGGFSTLDKDVVEQLIKEWAPVVWLAPEEKFMPLGVEEFLNYVHPMDKGKTFIPGMPVGDTSEKAYLVTNAEIEELLENENSFIYGRNPNQSPVPIYAVVTLCPQTNAVLTQNETLTETVVVQNTKTQQQFIAPISSTRGPYIPVSIDPSEIRNNTAKRSSRLYPVFQRVRRNSDDHSATYIPPQLPLNIEQSNVVTPLELVMGEEQQNLVDNDNTIDSSPTTTGPDNNVPNVNNFIANLADNVKFSTGDDDFDNTIKIDNSFNSVNDFKTNRAKVHNVPAFHVTFWMFYPYSQGKTMCTLKLGPLGRIPFPAVYGFCLGRRKDIGSHIGDWEHMSLFFNGGTEPEAMYVSAHDAGAYYSYNRLTGSFEFKKQETRKGILQRPNFPKTVTTFNNHPVLFAAKGSHGLWTAPGKHRFVKVARLYDINGFGTPWKTWKSVDITYENLKSFGRSLVPTWLSFKGKWGNPKSKCHPFRRIGLNFCEYTDGPTGIPLKEPHFQCNAAPYR